ADDWAAPTPVLTLNGYMRMRGELMDTFWLGRRALDDFLEDSNTDNEHTVGQGPDPFSDFRPIERRRIPGTGRAPADLDCVDEDTNTDGTCDVSTLRFANLRLRLAPQLNLSEDVRVKMTFDVLDNAVAGDAPVSYYGSGPAPTFFAGTDVPPSDSIVARRAWAEVRSRDLGELRFGRMPQEWGLGMVYNAAEGIDDDLSTDLDRVLFVTKLFGLYVTASYDFIAEGISMPDGPTGGPLEQSQLDDVDQLTFSVARRLTPEEAKSAHERGELMLQGGLQLTIRNQDSVPFMRDDEELARITEAEASVNTWDIWGQLRYRWLRLELEAAWRTGAMDRLALVESGDDLELERAGGSVDIDALGYALETEIRLVDEKLGLYFDHGLATGDSSVDGLSWNTDYVSQLDGDDTISTFRFHPNYKVDMILWRNLMRQVTGAYYFKPGISYDFVRSDFGQLFGARLDFIWSRASTPLQTWGNSENLGIELNVSLYFQTEDGPDLSDGFHSLLQYGVLFPMRGLSYVHEDSDLDTAQNLRLLLGVKF
ncbi:MAG: TIGR04551 family protein, partial [Myxococcales bacterium]|nr:TIGR04551 family protein [Myxococcales bacterium]